MITARYFSSCPSDSTSRWTPCPPESWENLPDSLWPARNYPRFRIWRPSSGRPRDFNPPEQRAAQHTLRHCPTPPQRACGPFGLSLHPPVPTSRDIPEVSRFSCRKYLGVFGVFDYAGLPGARAVIPGHVAFRHSENVSVLIVPFRSSIPGPPIPLASLRTSWHTAQNSGPSGSLLLPRESLSLPAFCRFIPAHQRLALQGS